MRAMKMMKMNREKHSVVAVVVTTALMNFGLAAIFVRGGSMVNV